MKKIFVLLFVLCLAASVYAQPNNAHILQINGPALSGTVSNGSQFYYEVYTASSGTLIVETTGGTDTYMIAYDEWFYEVDYNDDGGEGYNARIAIPVRADETYYFNVSGYSISTSGAFSITAVLAAPVVTDIELDVLYTFSIASGEVQYFRVFLGTDSFYSIQWNDSDRTHSGSLSNAADVIVGVIKEGSSSYLIPVSDQGNYEELGFYYSNEHRVHRDSTPRYDAASYYIIEVDTYRGGIFQLRVW